MVFMTDEEGSVHLDIPGCHEAFFEQQQTSSKVGITRVPGTTASQPCISHGTYPWHTCHRVTHVTRACPLEGHFLLRQYMEEEQ